MDAVSLALRVASALALALVSATLTRRPARAAFARAGFSRRRVPSLLAAVTAAGALLLAAGFMTPIAAGLGCAAALVAGRVVRTEPDAFGVRTPWPPAAAALALATAIVGPGSLSIDGIAATDVAGIDAALVALALAASGAWTLLLTRTHRATRSSPGHPSTTQR